MEWFAVALGFLSVLLAIRTEMVLREEDRRAKELIREMRERSERRSQEVQALLREWREQSEQRAREFQELLARMDAHSVQLARMVDEARRRSDEDHRDAMRALEHIAEILRESQRERR